MPQHAIAADQVSYADLYARWEHGNWRATDIDFARDREQWEHELSDLDRRSAVWTYSLFFHGEDSVTDNLSPFIDAAPREEQKYFLATQQVDEPGTRCCSRASWPRWRRPAGTSPHRWPTRSHV
jgi:ribonucleotide reductase beta subunit family protein with ferritin-like domain